MNIAYSEEFVRELVLLPSSRLVEHGLGEVDTNDVGVATLAESLSYESIAATKVQDMQISFVPMRAEKVRNIGDRRYIYWIYLLIISVGGNT